jgi:hypothetical protein
MALDACLLPCLQMAAHAAACRCLEIPWLTLHIAVTCGLKLLQ